MTSDELRKLAADEDGVRWYGGGACINDALREAADEIDRLTARLAEIDAGAQADEDDLNRMRDGTKLTRAGVVRIIVYQQQDIRELKADRDRLTARVAELEAVLKWIRQWDHLDTAGDGPYWKDTIDAALEAR